ncbi:MAG: DegT/DnrJ/EryC1/StrS family aminotransferase [Microbispora sp.]|nr:DegT/DnrJ/EryC1/StrS family aminotransferase [Microbispora sp.]
MAWPRFDEREVAAVAAVVRSGKWWRNEGQWVGRFEERFGELEGAAHVIGVTNGTQALELALLAGAAGPGEGVILPALTFYSTLSSVQRHGAVPVVADVDAESWNLALPLPPDRADGPPVTAVMPVHFGGMPVDMDRLASDARARGLAVVQDAAHGPGIKVRGRALAAFDGVVCYSFQHAKLLPGGEGGAVAFHDEETFRRSLLLQNCGRMPGDNRYLHEVVSSNFRMPELTGALLCCQLDRFRPLAGERAKSAQFLRERLAEIEGLTLQRVPDFDCEVSNYLIQARLSYPGADANARDRLVQSLQRCGVPVNRVYPPLFELEAYWRAPEPGVSPEELRQRCPNAVEIGATGFSLHHRVLLSPFDDQVRLVGLVEEALRSVRRAGT